MFEPDEGRNAEKAREILLLNDWVTPHEDFFPVLDKPMFFYWLIAISYKAFGVNEWAARLASVLAALGCFALVYRFALIRWGPWEALWSGLILISGVEFFILSRIVIFDMSLTLCITLALYSFYEAAHADETMRRRIYCVLMYGALGSRYSHQRPCRIAHSRLDHFLLPFDRPTDGQFCALFILFLVHYCFWRSLLLGIFWPRHETPGFFVIICGTSTSAALPPRSLIENNPGIFFWRVARCWVSSLECAASERY